MNSSATEVKWPNNALTADNFGGGNPYDKESGFLSEGNFTTAERNAVLPVTHNVFLSNIDTLKNDGGSEYLNYGMIKEHVDNNVNGLRRTVRDSVFYYR